MKDLKTRLFKITIVIKTRTKSIVCVVCFLMYYLYELLLDRSVRIFTVSGCHHLDMLGRVVEYFDRHINYLFRCNERTYVLVILNGPYMVTNILFFSAMSRKKEQLNVVLF